LALDDAGRLAFDREEFAVNPPTRLACLTPPGSAAIATLALRGPAAWTLVRQLAQRELPAEPLPGRFWLVRLGDTSRGEFDEVVVAVLRGGAEPWLELHTHGGREVLRWLEELFTARGVELTDWQQLERVSTGDAVHATALATLAGALTARTARIALDQVHGAFAAALAVLRSALERDDRAEADRLLAELERWGEVGSHLATPYRVVIAGAPNVGKSSLVNALAGYHRSVVSPLPGTTRDVVTTLLALDGWPVELADTAGWHDAEQALEREGIQRATEALQTADLALWMVDGSTAPVWPGANLGRSLLVVNKSDLPPAWSVEQTTGAVRVSAQTGAALAELGQRIADALVPQAPPPGTPVPFTAALAEGLRAARRLLATSTQEALEQLTKAFQECG
jgi:tRNA modification GTPase